MINKVNNLNEKSFKNYSGPDKEFKQKNIIFGYNGRGKSSLAKGIIQEFLKDNENKESNYRFFNRNYISDNLILKESKDSKIKGVIANFGKKDVDIEKQIELLELDVVDTKKIEDEIRKLDKNIRTEIDKVHDNKKGKNSIQKKPTSKTNKEVILLYNEDVAKAKKIENNEEKLIDFKGDNALEKQKLNIEKINIPIIEIIDNNEILKVKDIFSKTYDNIEIPCSKVVDWISIGLSIHHEGDKCKFCGGSPNLEFIRHNIEKYNSNEKQKAAVALNDFKTKLEILLSQIDNLLLVKDNISNNLEKDVFNNFNNIQTSREALEKIKEILVKKIENINLEIYFNYKEVMSIFKKIEKSYNEIILEKKKEIKLIDDKISKLNILIKGAIGLEIRRNTFINSNMELAEEKRKILKEINDKNKENLNKIEELKMRKSNTKDFAEHISSILFMLEVNLKLDVLNDDYIIKQSITNDILKLEDISEGEQNLLALLYFYYELLEDNEQKKLKNTIKLIVIDDPIASVDDVNKMYILELVKKLCELKNTQIFIFTHVWDDFCNICYNKKDREDTPFRFYEVKKDSNGSKVINTKTNETPYKHGFKEIYEFSLKPNCNDMSDCEIYHYPNIMRKILEEFLEFKVKNSLPTYSNFNNIKLVLCGNNPSRNDELAIGTLLNVCNILSHKASRNPDEILKAAKFLMAKIKNVDELHFNTMKE